MHTPPPTFAEQVMRDLLSRIHVQYTNGDRILQKGSVAQSPWGFTL